MIDAREFAAKEKLKSIKYVIPVVSGKGGVGKTTVSAMLALALSEKKKVGLLDLDFWGASLHILLGIDTSEFPPEDKGIVPLELNGIKFMSAAFYTQNRPLPIRGDEYNDAFLELIAVTRWDDVDALVIDMPPGLGDPFLNALKYVQHGKFVVVTTPSKLSMDVARRALTLLKEQNCEIVALVENMSEGQPKCSDMLSEFGIPLLIQIPFDNKLEDTMGNFEKLKNTTPFINIQQFLTARII